MRYITMKKLLLGLSTLLTLTACQNMPQPYNGTAGYQLESKSSQSAILSYTLATAPNHQVNQQKLQNACKKVMGQNKSYTITVLSTNEIANPAKFPTQNGVNIGHSQATFSLVGRSSNDSSVMRNTLDTHPDTLQVVRYQCS